jgi:hypothetical protein
MGFKPIVFEFLILLLAISFFYNTNSPPSNLFACEKVLARYSSLSFFLLRSFFSRCLNARYNASPATAAAAVATTIFFFISHSLHIACKWRAS